MTNVFSDENVHGLTSLESSDWLSRYLLYKFIGEADSGKGKKFLLNFVEKENNQYSYQNCWVLEEATQVMAAVNVYDGAQLVELRQPVVDRIRRYINSNFDPEDETQAGEYYIDSIGVNLKQQGKGTGLKLLEFIIDEYVYTRKQNLGLLVDEENPKAKSLYIKLGFERVGEQVLLGKRMEHLQIKARPFGCIL